MKDNVILKGIIFVLVIICLVLVGLTVPLFLNDSKVTFKIDPSSISIQVNEEKRVVVHSKSGLSKEKVTWSSNDESIAIVHDGIIKGIKEGKTEILAKTDNGLTASVFVEVTKKSSNEPMIKKDDTIKFKQIIAFYNGKEIKGEGKSKSGVDVQLTYYSDDSCQKKMSSEPIDIGDYYVIGSTKGNDKYNSFTSECIKAVIIKNGVVSIEKGQTKDLNVIINQSNTKKITWTSSNDMVATISTTGEVKGISTGAVKIMAKDDEGNSLEYDVIVIGNGIKTNYDSTSLKYWIENAQNNYVVTHIWVVDAYNQMRVAITEPKVNGTLTPRKAQVANTIISNEIINKGYANKGLLAFNASAMVSEAFNTKAPADWFGTAAIPIILNDGQVIRDSTSEQLLTGTTNMIYGLKSDGNLAYYSFKKGSTKEEKDANQELLKKLTTDGVKDTFGFRPVLVYNGVAKSTDTTPNIRQGICQIDKNNFIVITNTITSTSDAARNKGLSFKEMAEYMISYGCETGFNMDGGGSTSFYYKTSETSNAIKYPTAYDGRNLADMLYFVEK